MKVLELFAGTRSIGKAFEAKGHEVYSVEWDKKFEKPIPGNMNIASVAAKWLTANGNPTKKAWALGKSWTTSA